MTLPTNVTPVLETDRLRLRGHRPDDLAACVAMWSDPVVTRYISATPSPAPQTWARMMVHVGHWTLLGFGYWLVEERATGRFVGEVGFADFKRDIDPSLKDLPEAGWALAPAMHGKGYATEALRAAVAWGDGHFRQRRTICIIDPANLASTRLAQRCGYAELRRTTYRGEPTALFLRDPAAG